MKMSLRILAITAVLSALTLAPSVRAADQCPVAAASAGCKVAGTGGCCAASAKAQTVMLKIKGGDCAAIQKSLSRVAGVSAVETCSETKFTKVAYSGNKVGADKIVAAVRKAGYEVEARRVTFAVEGLACGACSEKVGQALSKVKGVSDNAVCHEAKTATVDFDPKKVTTQKLVAAIKAAGFSATESMN